MFPVLSDIVLVAEAPSLPTLLSTASVIAPVPPPLNGILHSLKKDHVQGSQNTGSLENDDGVLQLAKMVSQCGDDIEDIIKARNADDAKLW